LMFLRVFYYASPGLTWLNSLSFCKFGILLCFVQRTCRMCKYRGVWRLKAFVVSCRTSVLFV